MDPFINYIHPSNPPSANPNHSNPSNQPIYQSIKNGSRPSSLPTQHNTRPSLTSSSRSSKDRTSSGEDSSSPPRRTGQAAKNDVGKATATVAVAFQAVTAFYLYTQLIGGWSFAFTAGLVGNTLLFCFGVWTLLFAQDAGRVSKTTGADKRTSGFPFGNSEAAREKKREARGKKSLLKGR